MTNDSRYAPDRVREWVRGYFERTRSGDARIWAGAFAPGAIVEDPVGTPPLDTPEAILAQGETFVSAFQSVGLHETFVHVHGNEAAAMWEGVGVTTGGETVSFRGIDLFEFDENGRITRMRGFWTPPTR